MQLTTLDFTDKDFDAAAAIAKANGRDDENCTYTTTSSIIGLHYLCRFDGDSKVFSIVKTKELGFLVIKDLEDMGIRDDMESRFEHLKIENDEVPKVNKSEIAEKLAREVNNLNPNCLSLGAGMMAYLRELAGKYLTN